MKALALRYARALADVAIAKNSTESLKRELAAFNGLLEDSPDLKTVLASPAVARENKHNVIRKVCERMGASPALRNFLLVIVDGRRAALLPEIEREFHSELLARLKTAEAFVTSARELNSAEQSDLKVALEKQTGKKIQAVFGVDPELIGGAVARVGSTIYDGSVRSQLNRLRARLASE
ncbi:MAG: ATP synthase F1 subunit delta [Acidobacteria bacterium]|nr:ATP synthase F1 subunit delta [Acidobacteriota bacterium]